VEYFIACTLDIIKKLKKASCTRKIHMGSKLKAIITLTKWKLRIQRKISPTTQLSILATLVKIEKP